MIVQALVGLLMLVVGVSLCMVFVSLFTAGMVGLGSGIGSFAKNGHETGLSDSGDVIEPGRNEPCHGVCCPGPARA